MSNRKTQGGVVASDEVEDHFVEDDQLLEKRGTKVDQQDMHRMGKVQELRRNFRFVTIFGFTMVLMATWEAQLVLSTPVVNRKVYLIPFPERKHLWSHQRRHRGFDIHLYRLLLRISRSYHIHGRNGFHVRSLTPGSSRYLVSFTQVRPRLAASITGLASLRHPPAKDFFRTSLAGSAFWDGRLVIPP